MSTHRTSHRMTKNEFDQLTSAHIRACYPRTHSCLNIHILQTAIEKLVAKGVHETHSDHCVVAVAGAAGQIGLYRIFDHHHSNKKEVEKNTRSVVATSARWLMISERSARLVQYNPEEKILEMLKTHFPEIFLE